MIDYENDYYLIPKAFYTSPDYMGLPLKAKLTYAILRDEQRKAAEKGQFDENGDVFLAFSNRELGAKLQMSKPTFVGIRDILEEYGLLETEIMVSQVTGCLPTRIYVKEI